MKKILLIGLIISLSGCASTNMITKDKCRAIVEPYRVSARIFKKVAYKYKERVENMENMNEIRDKLQEINCNLGMCSAYLAGTSDMDNHNDTHANEYCGKNK